MCCYLSLILLVDFLYHYTTLTLMHIYANTHIRISITMSVWFRASAYWFLIFVCPFMMHLTANEAHKCVSCKAISETTSLQKAKNSRRKERCYINFNLRCVSTLPQAAASSAIIRHAHELCSTLSITAVASSLIAVNLSRVRSFCSSTAHH